MNSFKWSLLCFSGLFPLTGIVIAQQSAPPIHFKDRLISACIKDSELPPNASDIQRAGFYSAIAIELTGFDSPHDPLAEVAVRVSLEAGPEKDPVGYCLAKEREAYLAERSEAATAPAQMRAEPRLSNFDLKVQQEERARREAYAQAEANAKAQRDADNAEAWSGFFKTTSAMLGAGIEIQQQRIDNTNAQIAAANQQAAAAPAYQSYGQPLAASSGQQSYDPSKVQTRGIHKPEWDALQCLKLNQTGQGDSVLTGTGSQYFLNTCDKAIEVFWCKVGDECERGSGNTWKIHPQNTWPLSSGQYQAGACISGSSGGFVKDSSGKITGKYACTGP